MQDFKKLRVWQKAHQLTLAIYKSTIAFPQRETYGLTAQVRRSCASFSANIAEGCGKGSDADFARYLQTAMGSASETEYHLMLAKDPEMISAVEHQKLNSSLVEVKRMLVSLISKLRAES